MRMLYLECNAGCSGDMILGALAGLLDDPVSVKGIIEDVGIPGIEVSVTRDEKHHISGNKIDILINGELEGVSNNHKSAHRNLSEVLAIIDSLKVSDKVKEDAKAIYGSIADAESRVHGEPVGEIHFHEVGMLDAIADVVGACVLIETIGADAIMASPLRTGFGFVECAHGKLPVPAPATASIIRGIPTYAGEIEGEFTTPTGAAIVKHFSSRFGQRPRMTVERIGIGIGYRDYEIPNITRAFLGEASENIYDIYEVNCNIDDMTPEDLSPIISLLLEEGALDAMITSAVMKKGRPGYRLTCLCRENDRDRLAKLILANTSTIGLRMWKAERFEMTSHIETCRTEYGDIRIKVSKGYGITKWKPEHDDLIKAARAHGVSVKEVKEAIHFYPPM